jgi:hypothetical protein
MYKVTYSRWGWTDTTELLDKSKSEGPGFISIPNIISKMHITMHKKA